LWSNPETAQDHRICPGLPRPAAMNIARLSSRIAHHCRQRSLQRYGVDDGASGAAAGGSGAQQPVFALLLSP